MDEVTTGAVDAVRIDHLTHRFGEHLAVDDVSFAVRPGECFGLLGPNGAGKTTTIRILITLLPPQAGDVTVFGTSVRRHPMEVRRFLGYVPQQLSVDGALTARENVEWFARLYDVPRRERRARVDEALRMVDLEDDAGRLASAYSGGMIRRLELAQALVNRPALLVLDEPTVGLDPVARDGVWARVERMREQYGMTVLLTTHYMEEADGLCDRVAVMHRGSLRVIGTPADLKDGVGPGATLEDVFRPHTGEDLDESTEGGLQSVRSTRRTVRRVG